MQPETTVRDQSTSYGRAYADILDELFPHDADAERTAAELRRLATAACAGSSPRAVELGVGTGRVAIPLARLGCHVTGVDSSDVLLDQLRATPAELPLTLAHDDARTWQATGTADLCYCICATISMFESQDDQRAILRTARAAVHDRGTVVIETHSPDSIRAAHGDDATLDRREALRSGTVVRTRTTVRPDDDIWSLRLSWQDGAQMRTATEFSRMTGPDRLESLADAVGLTETDRWSTWTGTPYNPSSPLYISVFRPRSTKE